MLKKITISIILTVFAGFFNLAVADLFIPIHSYLLLLTKLTLEILYQAFSMQSPMQTACMAQAIKETLPSIAKANAMKMFKKGCVISEVQMRTVLEHS